MNSETVKKIIEETRKRFKRDIPVQIDTSEAYINFLRRRYLPKNHPDPKIQAMVDKISFDSVAESHEYLVRAAVHEVIHLQTLDDLEHLPHDHTDEVGNELPPPDYGPSI